MRLLGPLVLAALVIAAGTAAGAGLPRSHDVDEDDAADLETSSVRVEDAADGHGILNPPNLAIAGFALLVGVLFAMRARPRP